MVDGRYFFFCRLFEICNSLFEPSVLCKIPIVYDVVCKKLSLACTWVGIQNLADECVDINTNDT